MPVFDHRPSVRILQTLAGECDLVLVCARCSAASVLKKLARLSLGRDVVDVLIAGEVDGDARRLIRELIDDQLVPLVLTEDGPWEAQLANWLWLEADKILALPADQDE
jgi:hypothetical protein